MNQKTNNNMSVISIIGTVIFYILAIPFIIIVMLLAVIAVVLCLVAEVIAWPITGIVNACKSRKKQNDNTVVIPNKLEISSDDYIEVEDN